MIRLGLPPKFKDFSTGALQTIDSWFNQSTVRFNVLFKDGDPLLAEIPTNQWGIFKNSISGELRLYVNDNGVLKSVLLV